ncbi:MAG: carboxymuconolactone decarboxylase family protein [Pseudonocardiaceae bacterium]|nr:carboxymuconolactone decarboxylase family protein [Pseudonocardiaceae bacterium]
MTKIDQNVGTSSNARVTPPAITPDVYEAMVAFDQTAAAGLDPVIAYLIKVRASQMNGCAFCTDLHTKQARSAGERDQRLDVLPVWRGAPLFTDRERAALALTESMTVLDRDGVPDEVYQETARTFDEVELSHLIWTIAAINAWNRLGVSNRMAPA